MSMPEKPLYTVYLHVKPYVCKYLNDHFHDRGRGRDVVDLRADRLLYKDFIAGLTKDRHRQGVPARSRTCRVAVRVSYDILQRHGYALSSRSETQINVRLELRCRRMLMQTLSAMYIVCGNLAQSIRLFYDATGYDEDTWPSDSIRKVWQREAFFPKEDFSAPIIQKISQKFVEKLSHDWDKYAGGCETPSTSDHSPQTDQTQAL